MFSHVTESTGLSLQVEGDLIFHQRIPRKSLKRSKCFIGWIIATIVGILSIVTVGTVSGMALYNSIQNHDFITAWKKDSHDLWAQQAQIDQQIQITSTFSSMPPVL